MKSDCIFCKIVAGAIPSFTLYEDDTCMVILDKFPATRGQSLVIPKHHDDYIVNLPDEIYSHLFSVAKKMAKVTDKAMKPLRTCFVAEGFMVAHVHIRLHPAYNPHLELQGKEASNEELEQVANEMKKFL
jgi:histidine triad (HIT) family protein